MSVAKSRFPKGPGGSSSKKAPDSIRALLPGRIKKTGLDADWGSVQPELLRDLLWAVCFFSGSVTLGATRSGEAYSIKLYIGEPFDPVYFDGDEEGRAEMGAWIETLVKAAAESV